MKERVVIGIRIILFGLIFIYLFIHISYMCRGSLANVRENLSGFYELDNNSLDVIFIGTSGTFSAYAPMDAYEKYGYTSYNFTINAIGVDNMVYAVKEVMKNQQPKILVIDVYPYVTNHAVSINMGENVTRYNTDGYEYSFNRFKMIKDIVPDDDKLAYYLDIIKYHDNSFEWKNFFCKFHSVDKGFSNTSYGIVKEPILTNGVVPLNSEIDKYLTQMLKECKDIEEQYNTNILFIYYPYADITERAEHSLENVNYISVRVKECGFDFLNCQDFRDEFQLDNTVDYWDAGHFNIYGAEKVTNIIAAHLVKMYELPDKRGNEEYDDWTNDIIDWENNKKLYKANIDDLMSQYTP